jgi:hypothetical protein
MIRYDRTAEEQERARLKGNYNDWDWGRAYYGAIWRGIKKLDALAWPWVMLLAFIYLTVKFIKWCWYN